MMIYLEIPTVFLTDEGITSADIECVWRQL
jgi:hypothetical protein